MKWIYQVLGSVLVLEIISFTQFNLNYTVVANINPREISAFLTNQPAGFPLPDERPLINNTDESVSFYPVYYNTNNYSKTVSPFYKLYPFSLDGIQSLEADTALFNNATSNTLLYLADTILVGSGIRSHIEDTALNYAFVDDNVYNQLKGIHFNHHKTDNVICRSFSPEEISYGTRFTQKRLAILQQNNFTGWQVSVDGKPVPHFTVNHTLIGIMIPGGKHIVRYFFRNPIYVKATLMSFGLYAILILTILGLLVFQHKGHKEMWIYLAIGLFVIVLIFLIVRPKYTFSQISKQNKTAINSYLDEIIQKDTGNNNVYLFNTESSAPFERTMAGKNAIYKRFRTVADSRDLSLMLDTIHTDDLVYVWENVLEFDGLRNFLALYFPSIKEEFNGNRFSIVHYSKYAGNKPPHQLEHINPNTQVLSPDKEFSTSFEKKLSAIPSGGITVFASVKFETSDTREINLVMTLTRRGRTKYYESVNLQEFNKGTGSQNNGFLQRSWLKSSLKKGDIIKVYCWNSGKNQQVAISDFTVQIDRRIK